MNGSAIDAEMKKVITAATREALGRVLKDAVISEPSPNTLQIRQQMTGGVLPRYYLVKVSATV